MNDDGPAEAGPSCHMSGGSAPQLHFEDADALSVVAEETGLVAKNSLVENGCLCFLQPVEPIRRFLPALPLRVVSSWDRPA